MLASKKGWTTLGVKPIALARYEMYVGIIVNKSIKEVIEFVKKPTTEVIVFVIVLNKSIIFRPS